VRLSFFLSSATPILKLSADLQLTDVMGIMLLDDILLANGKARLSFLNPWLPVYRKRPRESDYEIWIRQSRNPDESSYSTPCAVISSSHSVYVSFREPASARSICLCSAAVRIEGI
jgi:hypothetical protein